MKFSDMPTEIKATMTNEQINKQIEIEMMEEGIQKEGNPGTFDMEMPYLKKEKYFRVGNIYFKTQKKAEQFIALEPRKHESDWRIGPEMKFTGQMETEITITDMFIEDEVKEKGDELIEYNKRYNEWDNKRRKYDRYISERNRIIDKIYSDRERAKREMDEKEKIENTMKEYLELTNGNYDLAKTFLIKHFGEEKVKDALDTENTISDTSQNEEE